VLVAPALQISHCLDTVPLFIPLSHIGLIYSYIYIYIYI
jgi:hypothetical protein